MRTGPRPRRREREGARTRRGSRLREQLRRRIHRRKVAWTAAAVAIALSLAGAVALAPSASAATKGAGFGTWSAVSTYGWHGSMMIDGVSTYCISPGLPAPVGASSDRGITGSVAGLSAAQLTRINLLVSKYGQTSDPVRAASVAWSVKAIANWNATLHEFGYRGNTLAGAINWTFSALAPADNVAIQRLATAYYDEAMATPAGTVAGSGPLTFTVDPANHYRGTVTASAPKGTKGTITLTNARFVDNGTNALAGAVAGTPYSITGVPPTADGAPYEVSGTGRFGGGYAAAVRLFRTSGQQNTAGPGGASSFTVSGKDATARSVTFQPVLTSQTAKVTASGRLVDTLSFATTAADGLDNPWFRRPDGSRVDVHFRVTAYGPLDRAPAETDDVPDGAPVAETVEVSTGSTGDSAPVTATFTKLQPGGIYTFVAAYDPQSTPAATRAFLPEGYTWAHAFGMANETTVVPMRIRLSSQISSPTTALSATDDDTVTVEHSGIWLKDQAGDPIPVVLRGQYVHYPTGAEVSPTDALPAGARVLGEVALTVTGDGDQRASRGGALPQNPAAPARIGDEDAGHAAWRWSVVAADQPVAHRGWVEETAEQYGVATQTATVALPSVTTEAQPGFSPAGSVGDTALVRGTLPAGGAELAFSAYTVPVKKAADGRWVPDAPAGTSADDLSWVCTEQNLLHTDVGHGRRITKPGDYPSPAIDKPDHAKIVWVESLSTIPTGTTPAQPIRTGTCGNPHETSYGVDVTTQAKTSGGAPTATPGEQVFDTADATGWVPEGGRISYAVYAWESGATPVCDRSTLQTTLDATTGPLAGGLYTAPKLTVQSERWTVPATMGGRTLGFVETLTDASGRTVAIGRCGAETEVVKIVGPHVNTGGTTVGSGSLLAVAVGLMAALGVGALGAAGGAIALRTRAGARRS